jgi:AcrR family transcriptional regulator
MDKKNTVVEMERAAPLGKREQKTQRRRRELSDVVIRLVRERGFDAISVNEVAEEASISVGGLYRYIKTKNDLLELVCDGINSSLLEQMKQAADAEKGIFKKLEAAIRYYWVKHWDASPAIIIAYREFQSLSEEAKQRYIRQEREIVEFLADLIRAGVLIDEFRSVDERLLAFEIILLSHMRALKSYSVKGMSSEDVLNEHLEMIFSRLRPVPAGTSGAM